ncbi:MAG: ABC transporter ATP-binding protein [Acidaminococcaceae bacterium]|nr:ABC transporter ATP-binding protein [Acidaminococcaceae bacterium]
MLKIENLSVAVQDRQILHDINLHIKPGEVHVLFGPNGTGKSTLIGTIMGFERYEVLSGKIYFKGHDITEAPCYKRARLGVGVMIQRPPTIRGLSLRQMIEICGATPQETEQMARWMGLADFLDRSVNEGFSGGELKRSELLQLMAQKPDLLLLDEPESGVDVENIALAGRAANYILHNEPCVGAGCDQPCCAHSLDCDSYNPLNSQRSGLIITHVGHILKYVPASHAHILYQGTLSCTSGDPLDVLGCISKAGYEKCVNGGCRRLMK